MVRAFKQSLSRYGVGGVLLVTALASTPLIYSVFLRGVPTWVKVLLTVAFVVLTVVYNYYKDVRPLLNLAERRSYFFDLACVAPLENLATNFDDTARLSVAEIRWKLPKRRSRFRVAYTLRMENALDKELKLRLDQGAFGAACAEQDFHVADLEDPERLSSYRLDARQAWLTRDLSLILAMPIRKVRKLPDGSSDVTDEVIGVVSIDSRRENARRFYEERKVDSRFREDEETNLLEEVSLNLAEMSKTCSWILS